MRSQRADFFPSELYWLDRVGPVSDLAQRHGGADSDVTDLVTFDPNGAPLCVAFDRLIEPDWKVFVPILLHHHDRIVFDARVTTNWPTSAGVAWWKGHDAPYMILNLYELLMQLAMHGAGRIQAHCLPHPKPRNKKYIPLPWSDVKVMAFLVERGDTPSLEIGGMRWDWP